MLVLAACGTGAGPQSSTPTAGVSGEEGTADTPASDTTTTTTEPASTSTSTTTTTIAAGTDVTEILVQDGQIIGGVKSMRTDLGSVVRLVVTSDTTDHVHVHGYDLFFEVAPGAETEIEFTADVPGIFEIEMEDSHLVLVELEVS